MNPDHTVRLHAPDADATSGDSAPHEHAVDAPIVGKRLIRLAELFRLLDVSKPTGYRLIAAGKVGPRAIRLTSACVRYDAAEVDAWLSTRRPDGNLHDAKTWPAAWEMIQRKRN